MAFDLYQLDSAEYEEAEELLDEYINQIIHLFAESPEGLAYGEEHPGLGRWVGSFLSYSYRYEGFTLPHMTEVNVDLVMDELLPRKITVMNASDAEGAVPELNKGRLPPAFQKPS